MQQWEGWWVAIGGATMTFPSLLQRKLIRSSWRLTRQFWSELQFYKLKLLIILSFITEWIFFKFSFGALLKYQFRCTLIRNDWDLKCFARCRLFAISLRKIWDGEAARRFFQQQLVKVFAVFTFLLICFSWSSLSHWEHLYWHRWQWWCWRWQMRLFFELILASMQLSCTSFFQTCDHSHWISLQTEQYCPISL